MYFKLKKKRILIFGNTGFVGSWLSVTLDHFNANILGVALKMKDRNYLSNTREFRNKFKTIYCDLNNLKKIQKKITLFKPEIIIHLASQPIVSKSYNDPQKTFDTNIIGTVKIFEIVKKISSVKKIIIFTSDKVYKNNYKSLTENSNLGGLDPYSASKSCQDIISQSYNYSFIEKKMIILRSGNIIGGGDWGKNRLMPDIIKGLKNKNVIKIRSINSTRPWLHILDVINAILLMITKNKNKDITTIYNLSPKNREITVKKILDIIKKNLPQKSLKIKILKKKFKEMKFLKLSSKKINNELGWNSRINIVKGILLTIRLYNSDKKSLFFETKNQISNFFD